MERTAGDIINDIISCADEADGGALDAQTYAEELCEHFYRRGAAARAALRAVLADYDLTDQIHGLGPEVEAAVRSALAALSAGVCPACGPVDSWDRHGDCHVCGAEVATEAQS